jgi:hypothetical protein
MIQVPQRFTFPVPATGHGADDLPPGSALTDRHADVGTTAGLEDFTPSQFPASARFLIAGRDTPMY